MIDCHEPEIVLCYPLALVTQWNPPTHLRSSRLGQENYNFSSKDHSNSALIMESQGLGPLKERHLQLLSVSYWIFTLYTMRLILLWFIIYIAFFTAYSPLAFIYMCWAYYDKEIPSKGGRKISFMQKLSFWKHFNNYFPIKLLKTADLSADKNYIFCYYPHGVFPTGVAGCFGNTLSDCKRLFPGLDMNCATLDMNFDFPIFREYCMAMGTISSSKESLRYVLDDKNKGNVVVLTIGGATESLYATPGPYKIVLKNRKGFVKIALETGASLVPVFSFGEINLYKQHNPPGSKLYNFQVWLKKYLGFALLFPVGRGIFIPHPLPVNVVVGKAIDVPKISNPTPDDIEIYHALFTEELVKLFNEHSKNYIKETKYRELIIL